MLTLPLPILTFMLSVAACALIWRMDLGNRLARTLLIAAFAMMSLGRLLIGLRFGYGIQQLIVIQRLIPLLIGPLIVFGFAAFIWSADNVRGWVKIHLGGVVGFFILTQAFPNFLSAYDVVITLTYIVSIAALIWLWRLGQDRMRFAPLDLVQTVRIWIVWAATSLTAMLIFETSIAISFAMQKADQAVTLISYGSVFLILSMLVAITVFSKMTRNDAVTVNANIAPDAGNLKLEQDARALLEDTKLYLDTELTLERLARRMHVPARSPSEAINQSQRMNVSQYVNGFRLKHAAQMLIESDVSVTKLSERSGFLTRSNFYREFERVYQQSPVDYRKSAKL